jgi:hypothetical protein
LAATALDGAQVIPGLSDFADVRHRDVHHHRAKAGQFEDVAQRAATSGSHVVGGIAAVEPDAESRSRGSTGADVRHRLARDVIVRIEAGHRRT